MPDLTVAELAALDPRAYIDQIKSRLRDDERWQVMVEPELVNRTRGGLHRIVSSIDAQKERITDQDPKWLYSANRLRGLAQGRINMLPVVKESGTKEGRAWRAFSARLANALAVGDSEALDRVQTPYGGMSARQWLEAREAKAAQVTR